MTKQQWYNRLREKYPTWDERDWQYQAELLAWWDKLIASWNLSPAPVAQWQRPEA